MGNTYLNLTVSASGHCTLRDYISESKKTTQTIKRIKKTQYTRKDFVCPHARNCHLALGKEPEKCYCCRGAIK